MDAERKADGSGAVVTASWLGRVDYDRAWELQRAVFAERTAGRGGDALLLLEHPHTYTLGRRTEPGDLVLDEATCAARGIAVRRVDRGGRATYHGPGQLVGYPIVGLGHRYDVVDYLRRIEDGLIVVAADLGIGAERDPRHTGVWTGNGKLAAIGVKITRGVTMHGFALNVTTDLAMFEGIVPCGIADRAVTSVLGETGIAHPVEEVARVTAGAMAAALGRRLVWDRDLGGHGLQAGPGPATLRKSMSTAG